MRVTRVTQRMDGYPQADGFVTPVTPLSPDPILPEISSEPAENVDFEPIVTPVTDVTPANGTPVWSKTDWQAFFDERAGRLEYDHGLPRQAAERRAFDFAVVEWLNQHLEPSDPGHCAWCNGADTSGLCVVPYGTNPVGPTWLHSQCWDAWYQERHRNAVSALKGLGITE